MWTLKMGLGSTILFIKSQTQVMHEMKWIWSFKSGKPKRVMRLKVHHDGLIATTSLEWCSVLCKIEANVILLVQLKERLEAP